MKAKILVVDDEPEVIEMLSFIRRLRNKLGAAAPYLETVRGVGYRLAED